MKEGAQSKAVKTKVADSEVIESIELEHCHPQPHAIVQLQNEHDGETSDAGSEQPLRTNSLLEKADASPSIHSKDHNFFHKCNFTTFGRANTKVHSHPMGLAQVFFSNCVVKVRRGHDLEQLIDLSKIGPVQLKNIESSGFITSVESLLPAFVFHRWISSMSKSDDITSVARKSKTSKSLNARGKKILVNGIAQYPVWHYPH
jgi:hypothetical protein